MFSIDVRSSPGGKTARINWFAISSSDMVHHLQQAPGEPGATWSGTPSRIMSARRRSSANPSACNRQTAGITGSDTAGPSLRAALLKGLALRLDRYEQLLADFLAERIERRLARLLSRLTPAKPASGWVRLQFSPSNSELARTIGTTLWQVSHYMRRFQQLGWLQRRPALWVHREGLDEFLESSARRPVRECLSIRDERNATY